MVDSFLRLNISNIFQGMDFSRGPFLILPGFTNVLLDLQTFFVDMRLKEKKLRFQ